MDKQDTSRESGSGWVTAVKDTSFKEIGLTDPQDLCDKQLSLNQESTFIEDL